MTDLLVKVFVKDNTNTDNQRVRTSYGVLASIVGILCNLLLFVVKISIGALINSISIMADAFNNLSDAASSVISFLGVKLAGRPADKEHPFGHGRLEYVAALIVAFLILLVGVSLFKGSFQKVLQPEEVGFHWILVLILCLSVFVKVWLALFNRKLGKIINSNLLQATSCDARNDVIVTSATIISILFGKFTGITIDGWMGLVVSAFVLFSGFSIAKDTLIPLLGAAIDKEVYHDITCKVESYAGIVGSHDLILHNYGPSCIMASIHAEVPNDSDMEEVHETIDRIERDIMNEMGISIVIHMDPIKLNDRRILESRQMVKNIVHEIEPQAETHDIRVADDSEGTNLIFDLVVPHSYKKEEEQKLLHDVEERIGNIDKRYHCIITIENGFIEE